MCKAATNISGDVPSSTPRGMTQYERIIETLTTLFPVWVCVSNSLYAGKIFSLLYLCNVTVELQFCGQVILGTILGIYKPAAVSFLSFCAALGNREGNYPLTSYSFCISQVTWLETDLFTLGLGFLMLSMGLTLTFEDFRRCLRNPWTVRSKELTNKIVAY